MLHEIGHVVGLKHTPHYEFIMYPNFLHRSNRGIYALLESVNKYLGYVPFTYSIIDNKVEFIPPEEYI